MRSAPSELNKGLLVYFHIHSESVKEGDVGAVRPLIAMAIALTNSI